jgi:hypothetical protein
MKPTRLLVMSTALAGCGVAFGMFVLGKHRSLSGAELSSSGSRLADSGGRHPGAGSAETGMAKHRDARADLNASVAGTHECPAPPRTVVGSDPAAMGAVLPESQWRANAEQVEREANHELKRLATLLDLDPVQQDKVFSSLVQNSPYYLPGMRNGGLAKASDPAAGSTGSGSMTQPLAGKAADGSSPAAASELSSYLNADQQELLAQEKLDREEWWSEVLPQLLPPSVGEDEPATPTPALTGTPESGDPPPDTKEFTGDEVLSDE